MQTQKFWVVGGHYTDTRFAELETGTSEVIGPFHDYDMARKAWRERAMATKSCASTRFTIAREG